MQIPTAQIEFKKKIGKAKGKDVWHVKTKGGLHMVTDAQGVLLGSGPHRAVARFLAQKFEPEIQFSELSKSDHYDFDDFKHLIPDAEELTKHMRELQSEMKTEVETKNG